MTQCELTVVVAYRDTPETLGETLGALRGALDGLDAEIVLCHPADLLPPPAPIVSNGARTITAEPDAIVPRLWALGLRAASGRVVAFTTSEFRVGPQWARGLLNTLAGGASGAGGTIDIAARAPLVARAAYHLRYSGFMPPTADGPVADIAGDNAAYPRSLMSRLLGADPFEFWEVELHRGLHREGRHLALSNDATATLVATSSIRSWIRHRYRHGRHSGTFRVRDLGHPWVRGVLAAPLVPAVLSLRLARRARARGRLGEVLAALPAILPLATAWSAGEAVGAWQSRSPQREAS